MIDTGLPERKFAIIDMYKRKFSISLSLTAEYIAYSSVVRLSFF